MLASGGLGAALVLATVTAVFALMQRERALEQKAIAEQRQRANLEALEFVFNKTAYLGFDTGRFDRRTGDVIRGILERLKASGYTGRVVLQGHVGRPIIRRRGGEVVVETCTDWTGPKAVRSLERAGVSQEYALALGQRVADVTRQIAREVGFPADAVETTSFVREAARPPSGKRESEVFDWERSKVMTVGECEDWNSSAAANDRVEMSLLK